MHVGACARAGDELKAIIQGVCAYVRGSGERERMLACDPPTALCSPSGTLLSEQLLQMIYVTSQEGLPGFLFHLQKKELCWNVIRELGIKLTAAFCFPCDRASALDCGIWFPHAQPELSVSEDRLGEGHREGGRYSMGEVSFFASVFILRGCVWSCWS